MENDEKRKVIDVFLERLRGQSANDLNTAQCDNEDVKELFDKHFMLTCKKCLSVNVMVNWEDGKDYGGYTGYSDGQKLFKCLDCGNAMSFWS